MSAYLQKQLESLQQPSLTERALYATGKFLRTPHYAGQYVGKKTGSMRREIFTRLGISFAVAGALYAIKPIAVVLAFTSNLGPYFEKAAKRKEEERLEQAKSLEDQLQSTSQTE